MKMTLNELVLEAYNNALANGYDLDVMSPTEVAMDMMDCDSDLEDFDLEDVISAVINAREILWVEE